MNAFLKKNCYHLDNYSTLIFPFFHTIMKNFCYISRELRIEYSLLYHVAGVSACFSECAKLTCQLQNCSYWSCCVTFVTYVKEMSVWVCKFIEINFAEYMTSVTTVESCCLLFLYKLSLLCSHFCCCCLRSSINTLTMTFYVMLVCNFLC